MKKKLLGLTLSALLLCSTGIIASAKTISQQNNQPNTTIAQAQHAHNWVEIRVDKGCHTYKCTICNIRETMCEY
ncbi:hypothetical protein LGL55_00680 [Clostridium tagluense]|uniref:hypothetical protein n=1 Tax=Clostridium tagluense TaxID=360422 RepID=UPI001CF28296|nr:hypothetical protein [Clostridium tagluense]MCB2298380.1 hypothetical protein [Clostridium tagluense]MCB2309629.1 hypothetical protein [Clostridium tagluense]MCB2314841.1 hypothetical protein [Clostridium tagluense]MCB2319690.1 hypothetical protein [Clostridium tagluense]MCB2324223.1 hypothetical protein [Clostridium tagluense]